MVSTPDARPTSPRRGKDSAPTSAGPVAPSTTGVLLHVVRAALEPDWSPVDAAQRLRKHARDDLEVLTRARSRLRAFGDQQLTLAEAKAIATLNVAIGELEGHSESQGSLTGGDGGGLAARHAELLRSARGPLRRTHLRVAVPGDLVPAHPHRS